MEQIARNVSGEGGFLKDKKYLIHDHDPLYTAKFESVFKAAVVEPVKLPARSPNVNPHAERFVRSVKEECLTLLLLSSEEQLELENFSMIVIRYACHWPKGATKHAVQSEQLSQY